MAVIVIFEVFNNALIGIAGLGIIAQDKRGFVIAALAMLIIKGRNCGEARGGWQCASRNAFCLIIGFPSCDFLRHN